MSKSRHTDPKPDGHHTRRQTDSRSAVCVRVCFKSANEMERKKMFMAHFTSIINQINYIKIEMKSSFKTLNFYDHSAYFALIAVMLYFIFLYLDY